MDSILVEIQITFLSVSSNFASEAQELTSLKMRKISLLILSIILLVAEKKSEIFCHV